MRFQGRVRSVPSLKTKKPGFFPCWKIPTNKEKTRFLSELLKTGDQLLYLVKESFQIGLTGRYDGR